MNRNGREGRLFVLLLLASALLFTLGSQAPFLGSDEPRLAQIAKEMLQGHEYIYPTMGRLPWLEKPVGLFWLMIGSYKIFGISEFSARLPSALAALITVILIYVTVSRLTDRKRGLASALILSTSAFFVMFSHAATCDMILTCCITATSCSLLFYEANPDKKHFLYAMYVSAGLGVLSKGFIALILPGLSILTYLILGGRVRQIFRMKPFLGLLIVLAVCALWFLPISLVGGAEFWDVYFYQQQVMRYTTGLRQHHPEGILFYIPIALLGTYPWTATPLFTRGSAQTPQARDLRRLAWCWFFSTIVFFSLSRTQTSSYILPAAPAFSILGGLSMIEYLEKNAKVRPKMILLMSLMNAFAVLAVVWLSRKLDLPGTGMLSFAAAIGVLTALSLILAVKQKFVGALATYALIAFVGLGIFVYDLVPQLKWGDSKMLSLAIKPHLGGSRKLLVYSISNYTPLFYTDGQIELTPEGYLYIIASPQQLYRYVSRKKDAYVLVDNVEVEWMSRDNSWRVSKVIRGHDISVLELRQR